MTIFVSTAYLDEAERCNRLALIHRGRLLACGTPDEVKQLMRGTILEIRTAEPRRAAAALCAANCRRHRWACSATASTLSRRDGRTRRQPSRGDARAAPGCRSRRSGRIEPSLEDVFISVLGRQDAESCKVRADIEAERRIARQSPASQLAGVFACARHHPTIQTSPPSPSRTWKSASAASWPSIASASRSAAARSSASSGPTGRANRPPSACSAAFLRPAAARGTRGRLRHPHASPRDQGQHRLHEPEVLALPGPHGRGEHRLLQRHLPHSGRKEAASGSSG